jgi:hypothetical protein
MDLPLLLIVAGVIEVLRGRTRVAALRTSAAEQLIRYELREFEVLVIVAIRLGFECELWSC